MSVAEHIVQYQAIFAVLIAVTGWVITHVLNLRAQRKQLLNQIMNEARKSITKELKEYQHWLSGISIPLSLSATLISDKIVGDWPSLRNKIDQIAKDQKSQWILILEEHEILFPETRDVRMDLVQRDIEINEFLRRIFALTYSREEVERNTCVEMIKGNVGFVEDQIALIEDIKIYIQNVALNRITGNMVPERKPLDDTVPRIVMIDGMLKIQYGQANPLDTARIFDEDVDISNIRIYCLLVILAVTFIVLTFRPWVVF